MLAFSSCISLNNVAKSWSETYKGQDPDTDNLISLIRTNIVRIRNTAPLRTLHYDNGIFCRNTFDNAGQLRQF
jgi:hypothetical protein